MAQQNLTVPGNKKEYILYLFCNLLFFVRTMSHSVIKNEIRKQIKSPSDYLSCHTFLQHQSN